MQQQWLQQQQMVLQDQQQCSKLVISMVAEAGTRMGSSVEYWSKQGSR
jgi:hypothetical protein